MKRSVLTGLIAAVAISLATGCCLCRPKPLPGAATPSKYAVLASTEIATKDDVKLNSEFWYDLVLTYCTLIDNGFEADKIFVLYGNGQDGSSKYDAYETPFCDGTVTEITDFSLVGESDVNKGNICNVLCCLSTGRPAKLAGGTCACMSSGDTGIGGLKCSGGSLPPGKNIPVLGDGDFLLTWIKGHGSALACDTSLALNEGYTLRDSEVADLFQYLRPDHWVALFETCDAGGWIGDFSNSGDTIVAVSSGDPGFISTCKETSWTATYTEQDATTGVDAMVVHGRFTYWVNSALQQKDGGGTAVNSDPDGNNLVSILEHFDAAEQKIDSENTDFTAVLPVAAAVDFGGVQNPAISTKTGDAPCVFIRLANPGNDYDVFSMDHTEDDSITPSVDPPEVPLTSPDIWVRHEDTGLEHTEHQPPKAGNDNHVYARAYNIGCADPEDVDVSFFWAEMALCDKPTAWTKIGEASIEGLPVTQSHVFHVKWEESEMPAAGPYCLIVQVDPENDPSQNDLSVASDNNKAQLEIEVVPP